MTRMRSIVITAGAGLIVTLSACGNGPPEGAVAGGGPPVGSAAASGLGAPLAKVSATDDLKFAPTTSAVQTGKVIQWTNIGSTPHNVTFDDHQDLTSQTLQQGDTWEVKFTTPGTYAYHCTFHPGMNGQITVGG
jgi:plastocyanin